MPKLAITVALRPFCKVVRNLAPRLSELAKLVLIRVLAAILVHLGAESRSLQSTDLVFQLTHCHNLAHAAAARARFAILDYSDFTSIEAARSALLLLFGGRTTIAMAVAPVK